MAPILNGITQMSYTHKGGAALPRKSRLDTCNGVFHIMAKGNNGCLLFRQPSDYSKFLFLLDDSRDNDPHTLLSYCLMPNHIHLLMETVDIPLSKIMHRLLLKYQYISTGVMSDQVIFSRTDSSQNPVRRKIIFSSYWFTFTTTRVKQVLWMTSQPTFSAANEPTSVW